MLCQHQSEAWTKVSPTFSKTLFIEISFLYQSSYSFVEYGEYEYHCVLFCMMWAIVDRMKPLGLNIFFEWRQVASTIDFVHWLILLIVRIKKFISSNYTWKIIMNKLGLSRAKLSTCGIKFEFDSVIRVLQFSCKFAGNFKLAVATFRYFQKYGILGLKLNIVDWLLPSVYQNDSRY